MSFCGRRWTGRRCTVRRVRATALFLASIPDPLDGIKNKRKPPGHEPDPFTPAEQQMILRHHEERSPPEVYDCFAAAFGSGMRPEELIELRRTDIDWAGNVARVRRVRSAGEVRPPKNGKFRDVEMTCLFRAALERREGYLAMIGAAPDECLLQNPVTRRPWNQHGQPARPLLEPEPEGVGNSPPTRVQHTRATRMLMAGCKPAWAAQQLGHSLEMFLRVYSSGFPRPLSKGAN